MLGWALACDEKCEDILNHMYTRIERAFLNHIPVEFLVSHPSLFGILTLCKIIMQSRCNTLHILFRIGKNDFAPDSGDGSDVLSTKASV